MSYIDKSIRINVPVKAANNQWTQFEEFPRFMQGVKEVQQLMTPICIGRLKSGGRKRMERGNHRTNSGSTHGEVPSQAADL
jgi:hypothetical protein